MSETDDGRPAGRKGRPRRAATIREMRLDDLPAVFALGERLFRTGRWRALRWTWDEYGLVDLFATDGDFCLVAEQDDALAGFVLGSLLEKRRSAWTYGYVEWLGVSPEAARRGIARALVERLTERFAEAGARILLADTDVENREAVAFFEKLGFGRAVTHVYMTMNLRKEADRRERAAQIPPRGSGVSGVDGET